MSFVFKVNNKRNPVRPSGPVMFVFIVYTVLANVVENYNELGGGCACLVLSTIVLRCIRVRGVMYAFLVDFSLFHYKPADVE